LREKVYIYYSDKLMTYNDLMISSSNVFNSRIIDVSLLSDFNDYLKNPIQ